jgi:hypothetical protein
VNCRGHAQPFVALLVVDSLVELGRCLGRCRDEDVVNRPRAHGDARARLRLSETRLDSGHSGNGGRDWRLGG